MISLHDKTALVTGGGAGIGRAIVDAFGEQGARVVVAEKDPARAEDVQKALTARGVESFVSCTDVTDRAQIERLMDEIGRRFGGLNVLVNNVGDYLGIIKMFDSLSDEEIDRLYEVNLKHVFRVTRAAIPLLREQAPGASIINISSIEGFRAIPLCSVYGAFKAAITGLTQSLALAYGPEGIRVNVIAPEATDTPQVPISAVILPRYQEHIPRWIPLGRFGTPQDVAGCAVFLASEELSGWVTGTVIHLDGGALAAGGFYRDPKGTWTNTPVIVDSGLAG